MKLFDGRYFSAGTSGRTYDVSPDGQRFLMIKATGADAGVAPPALIIVQHRDEELKRIVGEGQMITETKTSNGVAVIDDCPRTATWSTVWVEGARPRGNTL